MIFMSDRLSVAFSFSRRAHLLTTCKAGGGIPPVGRARALLTNCLSDSSPEGAGNVASEHSLCSRLYILRYQQNDDVVYCHSTPPPACENSAKNKSFGYVPQLDTDTGVEQIVPPLLVVRRIAFSATPMFSFQKRNRKKGR